MATKVKSGPMCIVTIWHREYLMPVATGMKIVQLLSEALEVDSDYGGHGEYSYTVGKPVPCEFKTVRPDQLRMPAPVRTLRLEHGRD